MSETTTDRLAEIEGQAAEYTPPEGWRVLQVGEVIQAGDRWVRPTDKQAFYALRIGEIVRDGTFIRRIEPEPQPEPEPENSGFEGHILREQPQPVQVREGRWRTRNGEIRHITPTPNARLNADRFSWHDAHYNQTWLPSGRYHLGGDSLFDLLEYLGPIEPEPQQTITPDDVAAEALAEPQPVHLQAMIESLTETIAQSNSEMHSLNMEIGGLQSQLEAVKAESAKRLETIQELRDEVSQVHRQWGDSRWRVEELEQKLAEAQPQPEASPVLQQVMIEWQAETIARLNSEIHELNIDIAELETQLESVKAELVQVSKDRQALQIELDAREQVPQAVSDRFEQGWDAGNARAVETIAEWLEPLRKGNTTLRAAVLFHLPHIMRTLTGLSDED